MTSCTESADSRRRGRLQVTFVLPSRGRAGAMHATVGMARALQRRGCTTRILCRQEVQRGLRAWLRRLGVVARATLYPGGTDWLADAGVRVEPFARLSDVGFKPDEVVIAVGSYTVCELAVCDAPVIKVRYCKGIPEDDAALLGTAWRVPMRTIAVSPLLVERLRALTGEQQIDVVPNGIDRAEYFAVPGRRDAIGTIYHSAPEKGGDYVIDIMRGLSASVPGVARVVFGAEPRPRLLESSTYTRLPSVAAARRLYSRCKVWLVASRREGQPGPVLEAMACGCAVVSSDNVGSRGIIRDGENGLLVPVGDTSAMVAAIRRVLGNDDLRARLVEAGMTTVSEYSWDRAADRMEQCLRRLVAEAEAAATAPPTGRSLRAATTA